MDNTRHPPAVIEQWLNAQAKRLRRSDIERVKKPVKRIKLAR